MFSLLLHIDEEDQERLIAELWERGTSGVVQRYETLEAFFDDTADGAVLARVFAAYAPTVRSHPNIDYARETEASFPPQMIGKRFFLVPPWNDDPTPPGRLRLVVNPGLACGTGWHPCTRMCLEAMETLVRPGARVLDVGTGSGILSAAACLLGGGLVVGCDTDEDAVRLARECAPAAFFAGSVDAVAGNSFDVAVANISAEAVSTLYPKLTRVAARLILSGFEEVPGLPDEPHEIRESEGWQCIVM